LAVGRGRGDGWQGTREAHVAVNEKVRKYKDEGVRLLAMGKTKEALDQFLLVQKMDPRDLANRQKVGDVQRKLGDNARAIEAYQSVAGAYAADGLLLKAIAVCKLILQVDPNHKETQQTLADLYGKKRGDFNEAQMPVAMSAAVGPPPMPGKKKSAADIRGVPVAKIPLASKPMAAAADVAEGLSAFPSAAPALSIELPPEEEVAPEPAVVVGTTLVAAPEPEPVPVAVGVAVLAPEPEPVPVAVPVPAPIPTPVVVGRHVQTRPSEPLVVGTAPARVGVGLPVGPVVPEPQGTAASWGAPQPAPVVAAPAPEPAPVPVSSSGPGVGPPSLDYMEMPAGMEVEVEEPAAAAEGDAGEMDFGDLLSDEPAEPAKLDVTKLPPIPLFNDLSKNAFIELMQRMDVRCVTEGETIIQEGGQGDSFFIIVGGTVKITKVVGGQVMELARLSDGAFFGEMALLSDAPRTASVVAVTDCELFEISRDTLEAVTSSFPSVKQVMNNFYKQRLLSNLLSTSPIFAPFDKEQKKALIGLFKSREVQPGECILTEGQKGDGLYVVMAGRCAVTKKAGTQEVELARLKEGDVFGEISLVTRSPVTASIQAVTRMQVLRLPRKQFNEIIMTHPQVLELASELSAKRQENTTKVLESKQGGLL
jgi:CRP-like cAMP-binding protein